MESPPQFPSIHIKKLIDVGRDKWKYIYEESSAKKKKKENLSPNSPTKKIHSF